MKLPQGCLYHNNTTACPVWSRGRQKGDQMKKTQEQRILNHLQRYHKITPIKAWNSYGVYRLSDVILKLRRQGYPIETNRVNVKNRFGEKCRVAEYTLWA